MSVTFSTEIDEAECLLALWDATNSQGLGRLHSHITPTLEQAQEALKSSLYVDYFYGKPIKTGFDKFPTLRSWGYDRDAGSGKMQEVADGVAKSIGPSKRLNKRERKRVFNQAKGSIKVVSMNIPNSNDERKSCQTVAKSTDCLNGKEMISWLVENRPCQCKPVGVQLYLDLLKYDLVNGVSGFDNTKMPKFDMNDWISIVDYATTQAKEN